MSSEIFNTGNLRNTSIDVTKIKSLFILYNDILLFKLTNKSPRFNKQGIYYWSGGKIIEEANASSNVDDNVSINHFYNSY